MTLKVLLWHDLAVLGHVESSVIMCKAYENAMNMLYGKDFIALGEAMAK